MEEGPEMIASLKTKLRSAIKKGKGIEEEKNRLAEENESLKLKVTELEQEIASLNEKLRDQDHKLQNAAVATDGATLSDEQSQAIKDEMVSHDAALEQLRSLTERVKKAASLAAEMASQYSK